MNWSKFRLLLLGVCATAPLVAPGADDSQAKVVKPTNGKAAIYVYRNTSPRGFGGKANRLQVILDGRGIGYVANATFFVAEIDPGEHDLWVGWEGMSDPPFVLLLIDAVAGQSYFVRAGKKQEDHARVESSIAQQELVVCCVLAKQERKVLNLFQ